jgi:hypothetical protein
VSPAARYRGLENQLYRIEIHDGGTAGGATFKWSRDNGCVVFPLESLYGTEAMVTTLGRDRDLGVEVGDWLEVLDDHAVLRGLRLPLRRVESIDILDRLITFETATSGETGGDPTMHPFVRRWDQQAGPASAGYAALTDDGVLRVQEGVWIELEDGVQIEFEAGGNYTPGDFWIVPARTATGDVEWPQEAGSPAARPPNGIGYAYAPLAYVGAAGVSDLRSAFVSLATPL